MHGFGTGSALLVNAEVDSMGGVVDGGVATGTKPSPRRAAIEKAQAELRLEYDVREERRRELEFLEKGGDPLDFKFGHAASVSVQSTSHTGQHADQNLISEAKGSFALTASPHGDSVESSGRLGVTTACEPNSADNFDGENEILQSERKSMHPSRGSIIPSEHSSQFDGHPNTKESDNSPIFHPKKGQAYRRRNRSRINRDGPRTSSADMASRGGHGSSVPGRHGMLSKSIASEKQFKVESDGTQGLHSSTTSRTGEFADGKSNIPISKEKLEEDPNPSLKADEDPVVISTVEPVLAAGNDNVDNADIECRPSSIAEKTEDDAISVKLNETSKMNGDGKCGTTDAVINNAPVAVKGLDYEASCSQTNVSVDGNRKIDSGLYTNLKSVDSNGTPKDHQVPVEEESVSRDEKTLSEKVVTHAMETSLCKEDQNSIGHQGNGFVEKDQDDVDKGRSSPDDETKSQSNVEEQENLGLVEAKSEKELSPLDDCVPNMETSCTVRPPSSLAPTPSELDKNDLTAPPTVSQSQPCSEHLVKPLDKAQEDRILEKARIIEAKHKRIAELSFGLLPREHRPKSHWDFVLEEMAWLANDFAQERLWKVIAATQISHHVAFAARTRLEEKNKHWKHKAVAHTLAKAVMDFWHSVRLSTEDNERSQPEKCKPEASSAADEMALLKEDKASQDTLESARRIQSLAVHGYAVRFMKFNCCPEPAVEVEVSRTADVACDISLPEVLWQDQFTEESLFYAVPPAAMEMYRKSIESSLVDCERMGNSIQEDVDTSVYDADFGYQENDFEEDEGENMYYMPGAHDSGQPSKKKRKNLKSYGARYFEFGGEFTYGQCVESRNGTPQSAILGKRPTNNLHVDPIPTKRMRTASRQRVVGPFSAGPASAAPVLSRADASSGDTNSFQDDQSTLHGGSVIPRGTEVDSTMNFEKQSMFGSTDFSEKPKKKKKHKHQNVGYDQRWPLDSSMQNDQKDHVRKRLDNHPLESNGNSGLFGQHTKKPKMMKHSLDTSFDNTIPVGGSIASPAASQMSSQSKIIKLIGGRDRGRKAKGQKGATGQLGSGGQWTLVEDQALVVLVHDMGPNWELVSDCVNSILQFKCIFRKPQECKERHKYLMDMPSGDGADSAEDSGSSQPYPSTLPGIPKGSARQLFRSLHDPVEQDNIKSHFENIIRIGQQLHYRKKQNDIQDLKQIVPVHGSHVIALSQAVPNNLNGGVLTPLDLCDTAASNQDQLSIGYQSPHSGGIGLPNQGNIASVHAPGGLNSSIQGLQGSPSMGIGNNMSPQSSQFTSTRDGRYAVPRSTSLPIEEQQRLQQYNPMLPGRNAQPSNLSSSGSLPGNDRGMRMLPGGNGVGIMPGMNRNMSMARPGLQGIPSSSMLNSGSMLPSNMGGISSNLNAHTATSPGQGNTIFRPRDTLHMMRPAQSSEHQRQVVPPEIQMQATQANSSGSPSFGGMSSGYPNQAASPPLQTYPGHQQHPISHQHPHALSNTHPHLPTSNNSATPEQQAYLRLARERQMQQRLLQRQQQQHQQQQQHHPASGALMTPVQAPSQLPMSSSLQSGSPSSQSVSLPSSSPSSPMTHIPVQSQQQKKHQLQSQGLGRSPHSSVGGVMNQVGKQRQRQAQQLQQQYQQSGRQHPLQRQQSQSQQAKLLKGIGRSNMSLHQNIPIDPSNLNGLSVNPGAQVGEKGDPAVHLMQGQGLYPGSSTNVVPPSQPLASPQTSSQPQPQRPYSNTGPPTLKAAQQLSSHLEGSSQGLSPAVPSHLETAADSNQGLSPSVLPSLNHQQVQGQPQPSGKVVNQSQPTLQRAIQQNRRVTPVSLMKSQAKNSPVEQTEVNISGSTGTLPACTDSASASAVSSSATNAAQMVQESACESAMNSNSSPSGPSSSQGLSNSSCNEPVASVSRGLGQRQMSDNMASHGHGGQWQQQQSQLQPPPLHSIMPQKASQQPLLHLEHPPQRASQPQPPQIQAGQNSVLMETTNSRSE